MAVLSHEGSSAEEREPDETDLKSQGGATHGKTPVHPGVVLLNKYLLPRHITQSALAEHLGISIQRINEIVRGKRAVTPETAWLLSGALGTTPEFWVSLQARYDMEQCKPSVEVAPLRDGRRKHRGERQAELAARQSLAS